MELILACCSPVLHFEKGKAVNNYTLDDTGEEKLKKFFIKPLENFNISLEL